MHQKHKTNTTRNKMHRDRRQSKPAERAIQQKICIILHGQPAFFVHSAQNTTKLRLRFFRKLTLRQGDQLSLSNANVIFSVTIMVYLTNQTFAILTNDSAGIEHKTSNCSPYGGVLAPRSISYGAAPAHSKTQNETQSI